MSWPDGLNPHLDPARRAELLAERDYRRAHGLPWIDDREPEREPPADPAVVELTDDEYAAAFERAEQIIAFDDAQGWSMKFDPRGGETKFDVNLRGYCGELAAKRVTGLPLHWEYLDAGYRGAKHVDLGNRTEVRTVLPTGRRLLRRRPGDPVSRVFLLVIGVGRRYRVAGWMEGRDLVVPARRDPDPPSSWTAREDELRPLPLPPDA